MAEYAAALEAEEKKMFSACIEYQKAVKKITEQINALDDPRFMRILFKRYIERKSFATISEEMAFEYYYVCRMHGAALGAFYRRFKKEVDDFNLKNSKNTRKDKKR